MNQEGNEKDTSKKDHGHSFFSSTKYLFQWGFFMDFFYGLWRNNLRKKKT